MFVVGWGQNGAENALPLPIQYKNRSKCAYSFFVEFCLTNKIVSYVFICLQSLKYDNTHDKLFSRSKIERLNCLQYSKMERL